MISIELAYRNIITASFNGELLSGDAITFVYNVLYIMFLVLLPIVVVLRCVLMSCSDKVCPS